jgi:hypothetical protein
VHCLVEQEGELCIILVPPIPCRLLCCEPFDCAELLQDLDPGLCELFAVIDSGNRLDGDASEFLLVAPDNIIFVEPKYLLLLRQQFPEDEISMCPRDQRALHSCDVLRKHDIGVVSEQFQEAALGLINKRELLGNGAARYECELDKNIPCDLNIKRRVRIGAEATQISALSQHEPVAIWSDLEAVLEIQILARVRGVSVLEEGGHRYKVYLTCRAGHRKDEGAADIAKRSAGRVSGTEVSQQGYLVRLFLAALGTRDLRDVHVLG